MTEPYYADERGCCTSCKGTGRTYDASTGGMCWNCRGTGHPHEPPCSDEWCPTCERAAEVVDVSIEEQIIPDRRFSGPPSFRAYHVTWLACGHEIAVEANR